MGGFIVILAALIFGWPWWCVVVGVVLLALEVGTI